MLVSLTHSWLSHLLQWTISLLLTRSLQLTSKKDSERVRQQQIRDLEMRLKTEQLNADADKKERIIEWEQTIAMINSQLEQEQVKLAAAKGTSL